MPLTWCRALTTHLSARGRSARASGLLKSAPASCCHSRSSSCSRLNRMNLPAFHSLLVKLRLDTKRSMDRFRSWPAVVPALGLAEVRCCIVSHNCKPPSTHSTSTQMRQLLTLKTHHHPIHQQLIAGHVPKLHLAERVHLPCWGLGFRAIP